MVVQEDRPLTLGQSVSVCVLIDKDMDNTMEVSTLSAELDAAVDPTATTTSRSLEKRR